MFPFAPLFSRLVMFFPFLKVLEPGFPMLCSRGLLVPDQVGVRVSEILEWCSYADVGMGRGRGGCFPQQVNCFEEACSQRVQAGWDSGPAQWSDTANLSWAFPHSRGLIEPSEL